MSDENKKYKILIFAVPGHGHINPVLAIVNEILSTKKADVAIITSLEFKEKCEATGAKFIENIHIRKEDSKEVNGEDIFSTLTLGLYMINLASKSFEWMISLIKEEKPDCIFYDHFYIPARIIKLYIEYNYEINSPISKEIKRPVYLSFQPGLKTEDDAFIKNEKVKWYHKLWMILIMIISLIKYSIIKFKYKIKGSTILDLFLPKDEKSILSVLSELQPKSHLLTNFTPIGPCISNENSRVAQKYESNDKLKQILDRHESVNPIPLKDYFLPSEYKSPNKKLIYVSLGTIFNSNPVLLEKLFKSFEILNDDGFDFDVVVALGQKMFDLFNEKNKKGELKLCDNILILPRAPQIDILQKASLFITHCGMNSASESVHFGVPVLCLPQGIATDQPIIANRLADELGFGIRLDSTECTINEIVTSIKKIFNDNSYLERILRLAHISQKTDGAKNGAKYILNLLDNKNKKIN